MTHTIQALILSFFHTYLRDQVGCSPNTIQSYCECIRLLVQFCSREQRITADELDMETINDGLVLAFLDSLEQQRGNSPRTRNQRLAAIRSFYRYLALQEPTLMDACRRICSIRAKKTEHKIIEALNEQEVQAILSAVASQTPWDQRDYALLLLMYNTGARVQELIDLEREDLKLDSTAQVKLKGKGRKERVIPLWRETATALQQWVKTRERAHIKEPRLFVNAHRRPISRFGIAHILAKYAAKAAATCPSLQTKRVTPHVMRHTTALHLIQSNVDVSVAKDWLGHADIRTTSLYIDINIEMRRKALEQCPPPGTNRDEPMLWHQPHVMALLRTIAAPQLC
jgi:site-specific recombinase XerD